MNQKTIVLIFLLSGFTCFVGAGTYQILTTPRVSVVQQLKAMTLDMGTLQANIENLQGQIQAQEKVRDLVMPACLKGRKSR